MGQALGRVSGKYYTLNMVEREADDTIALCGCLASSLFAELECEVECFRESDDERDIFCARPKPVFLTAPMEKRNHCACCWTNEYANTFWPIKFVSAKGQEIHRQRLLINGEIGCCLGCITVEWNSMISAEISNAVSKRSL